MHLKIVHCYPASESYYIQCEKERSYLIKWSLCKWTDSSHTSKSWHISWFEMSWWLDETAFDAFQVHSAIWDFKKLSHTSSHMWSCHITLRGTKWWVHFKDEATAEGQTQKWRQDTNLDLPPTRSGHFPIYPKFEKYYYWLLHCSKYSLDTPGRGGEGKEGGSGREESFWIAQIVHALLWLHHCLLCFLSQWMQLLVPV